MEFKEWLSLLISIGTLLGMFLMAYNSWKKPTENNSDKIKEMDLACGFKHSSLDEKIGLINKSIDGINKSFLLLKENDLKHIEGSVKSLELNFNTIATILDERLPKK